MSLSTQDLFLLPPELSLAGALADYWRRNRDFLAPYEPQREEDFYTEARQRRILREELAGVEAGNRARFYLVRKGRPNEIIGSIGLTNIVRGAFHSCFMGYQLDQRFLNQGYMTQAVNAVVDYGFRVLNLHRIEGNVMPRNRRSIHVAEKCGFVQEGLSKKYLFINGVWEDHVHLVRLNPDWKPNFTPLCP